MQKLMNEKIIPKIMAFINTKGIQAIKDGMVYSMPLLIVGSVFLIITNFPIQAVVDALETSGIKAVLEQTNGATFNISAMIAVLGISYNYIKLDGQEPLSGAIVALGVFIMMTPASIVTESGDVVGGIIDKGWTAGKGMVGAIIVGLAVGAVYCWFMKRNIRIKMPAGVPEGVSNAFSALIPGAVIVIGATVIHGIPHDGDGSHLQCDPDPAPEHDGFHRRRGADVFPDSVFMVLRRTRLHHCGRYHDWNPSGQQP